MKKKVVFSFLIFLFAGTPFLSIYGVEEKRLIVMDFKNVEKDKDYDYLEPSITDAVIEGLKKELIFKLMPEKDWKLVAKNNFFFEDSFHTPTIGMQLGLLGKQDVVIGGGFTIRGNEILTNVHILGIADRKVLKQFEVKGFADNRIWDSIKNISDTIVEAARDILPNEKEWSSIAISGRNQVSLALDLSPLSIPSAFSAALPSGTEFSINPNDFPLTFRFGVEFMSIGFFLEQLTIFGGLTYGFSSQSFAATGHSPELSAVEGQLTAYTAYAGSGYRVFSYKSFYVMPRLNMGYSLAQIDLDFTKLTNPPSAISGTQDLTLVSASIGGVSLAIEAVGGYQLLANFTVELKTQYQMIFINDFSYSNLYIALNLGYKF